MFLQKDKYTHVVMPENLQLIKEDGIYWKAFAHEGVLVGCVIIYISMSDYQYDP